MSGNNSGNAYNASTGLYNLVIRRHWFRKNEKENSNYIATGSQAFGVNIEKRLFRKSKVTRVQTDNTENRISDGKTEQDFISLAKVVQKLSSSSTTPLGVRAELPDNLVSKIESLKNDANKYAGFTPLEKLKFDRDHAQVLVSAHQFACEYQKKWGDYFVSASVDKKIPKSSQTAFSTLHGHTLQSQSESKKAIGANQERLSHLDKQIEFEEQKLAKEAQAAALLQEARSSPKPSFVQPDQPPAIASKSESVKKMQAQIVAEQEYKKAMIIEPGKKDTDNRHIPEEFKEPKPREDPNRAAGHQEIVQRLNNPEEQVNIEEQKKYFSNEHIVKAGLDSHLLTQPAHSIAEDVGNRDELLRRRLQENLTSKFEHEEPSSQNPPWREDLKQKVHQVTQQAQSHSTPDPYGYQKYHDDLNKLGVPPNAQKGVREVMNDLTNLYKIQQKLDSEKPNTQHQAEALGAVKTKHSEALKSYNR